MPTIHMYPGVKKKMLDLVMKNDTEIGWYGICERRKDDIYVKDILVYPQIDGDAHVTTQGLPEYDQWIIGLDNETVNNIRLAGHSHVNFDVRPSATDRQDELVTISQLGDDDYFLFLILNKRLEFDLRYYNGATGRFGERKGTIASEPA